MNIKLIDGYISSLIDNEITEVEDDFMYWNETAKYIELRNAVTIGDYFLYLNEEITEISMQKLTSVGSSFSKWV